MAEIAGLPFVRLKFDKDGDRVEPGTPVRPAGIGNLIVIAHGWKNDEAAADRLYATLVGNMRAAPGGAALVDGTFGVTGVYWPAFVFKPDLTILPADVDGQAGGTAGTGEADVSAQELRDFADAVADFLGVEDADSFRQQVLEARGGGGAADDLADRLRAEVSTEGADAEVIFEQEGRDLRGRELFEALKAPPALGAAGGDTGAAMGGIGAAFRLPRFLSGPRAAVARMLNQFTYFEMKKRAGVVGVKLAATLQADGLDGVGLHLVGHSFGARLVTATASRLTTIRPKSLSLLQGAYSHNGLGVGKGTVPQGAFRNVVADRRVTGPIVITHTRNDTAVGIAYAVASRASGVNAAAFGGPDDAFGGMGANGAQLLGAGEAVAGRITSAGAPALRAGLINNLLADDVVKDHNDVANPGVARVVLAAVQA